MLLQPFWLNLASINPSFLHSLSDSASTACFCSLGSPACTWCRELDHQGGIDRACAEGLPAGPVALSFPERAPPGVPLQPQQALLLRDVAI